MANLPEQSVFPEGIYQLEEDDDVRGGPLPEGLSNLQAKLLADRTKWLRDKAMATDKRVASLEGIGGPLDAHDFENATPSDEELTQYACENIWGSGGDWLWDAIEPWNSTYTIGGVTHQALEIFSATWVNNSFNRHRWVLVNTPNTEPRVFSWEDVGQDMVAIADDETAGMVKGGGDIVINPDGEMFISEYASVGDNMALYDRSKARNLLDVLGIRATPSNAPATLQELADAMAILRQKINALGDPDFSGLRYCDYLDLPYLDDGTTNIQWEGSYKNLRIMIAGFNIYKHAGSTENTKNHILFQFADCPFTRRLNATNTNAGGWAATEARTYFEGDLKSALTALLGNCLYGVQRLHSTKDNSWSWSTDTVFLPTEYEIFGAPIWSEVGYGGGFQCQWPIYRESAVWLVKKRNGSRLSYWTASPSSGSAAYFVLVSGSGSGDFNGASSALGCAPAFCVSDN